MAINPIHFAHGVCEEFLRYIFSAFPLADPDLAGQARSKLTGKSALDIPLVRGPYVSLSDAFAKGEPVQALADRGLLHPIMPKLIGYPTMWRHQQQVFEAVRDNKHVLVATGTGSGKTESFLYPIVDDLIRQRERGITSGIAAVVIYPMNALANDQLDRLRDMLGGTGISFGLWTGTTPDKARDVEVDRFEGSSRDAYLTERRHRREEAQAEDRAVRPLAPQEECCSEEEIEERRPRILLTNYRQLEILTTRAPEVTLFAEAPLKYLVFDEAHTYAGAVGAEVACLIRRLRVLARKSPDEVICIGTSATLTDNKLAAALGPEDDPARRFATRFFGVDPNKVAVIGESYVSREWPSKRFHTVAPQGNGMERLARVLKALDEPVDLATIKAIVEELTGEIYDPGDSWRDSLHDHLVHNEYVFQTADVLRHPLKLDQAAWIISQRVAPGRLPEGDRATAELLAYLMLGAAAQKDGESLLRPKVHFFLRGLDEMVVAFGGEPERPQVELFLSLADAKEAHGGRLEDAFPSVLVCRCGQHFFQRHYKGLVLGRGANNRLRAFEQGNAVEDDRGVENAYWPTAPAESGTRLVFTNRLLEEAETGIPNAQLARRPRGHFCRQCGALHRDAGRRCLADGCGHEEPLLPMMAFGDLLRSCPSCGTLAGNIGGRSIEPARQIRAVTVADVHILAQAMINAAPDGHKKLIVFADSRQDAAFQAGWMQDHARRIRLRHLMNQVISEAVGPITLDKVADSLAELFRRDRNLIDTLLPELTGEYARDRFGSDIWISVSRSLRYMVLREFTTGIRRTDNLESMGLARISYAGLSPDHAGLRLWAGLVGLEPEEAVNSLSLLLDIWRRNRILWVPHDPIYSRFHAKDDQYIQAGLLPLSEFRPEGLLLTAAATDRYARSLLSARGVSAVMSLLKKWSDDPDHLDVNGAATALWEYLTKEAKVLAKVTLRSSKDRTLGRDVWQVNAEKVQVEPSHQRERCTTCQRVMTRRAPSGRCTGHNCRGVTVREEPDPKNYDVWLMGRPFVMVSAEEHTAQVPGEERNRIEQDFKSKHGKTNCLVATPTLEMGVNIGLLDMALMRNVPPKASNYWQRAGRAGREERMAVIVTYCRRSNHDRYFFDDPLRLLGGAIEAPAFNLRNPLMVAKHVRSAVLSELLLRAWDGSASSDQARDVLKRLFPLFIRDYLLDKDDRFLDVPADARPLAALLAAIKGPLADRLVELFARHWPEEAGELASRGAIERAIDEIPGSLEQVIRRLHRRLMWARDRLKELFGKMQSGLIDSEERQLFKRCDSLINNIVKRDRSTYTLTVLGVEGFLPGYGIYEGGITASAQRGFGRNAGPRAFDLSRSNVVALREFVPGNRLYANRGTYYASRYHLGAEETSNLRVLRVNADRTSIAEQVGNDAPGQTGGQPIPSIPLTDLDLAHESRITEDELLRFSMPVSVLGRLRRECRGGTAYRIGQYEVDHLRGQGIELANIGEAGRVRAGELGHMICSVCGAAKTPYAVPDEMSHFLQIHNERCGKTPDWLALTVQADVDMLRFREVNDQAKGINIGEALRTAAARLLDMGHEDLQLLLVEHGDRRIDLLIYDPMPGGSGLLEQMLARWRELIASARALLVDCPGGCDSSCYSCLKTFRNQFHHGSLDRNAGLVHVGELDHEPEGYRTIAAIEGDRPTIDHGPSNVPEARLERLLRDHYFPSGKCRQAVVTEIGLSTTPDWLHEESKVAIYLDGMSRNLHGDPKTAREDQIRRMAMESDGYQVIVIQTRDLNDPQALRLHLRNIAQAMGRVDLVESLESRRPDHPGSRPRGWR